MHDRLVPVGQKTKAIFIRCAHGDEVTYPVSGGGNYSEWPYV